MSRKDHPNRATPRPVRGYQRRELSRPSDICGASMLKSGPPPSQARKVQRATVYRHHTRRDAEKGHKSAPQKAFGVEKAGLRYTTAGSWNGRSGLTVVRPSAIPPVADNLAFHVDAAARDRGIMLHGPPFRRRLGRGGGKRIPPGRHHVTN